MVNPMWRVEVDARCIGSGLCTAGAAKAHFTLVGDRSVPVREVMEPDEDVLDAAECCPMEAIFIRNAEDGSLIAPI